MRNVPGDGDCMFLAVALATSTSMGLGGNDALLATVAAKTRDIVAQFLSAPDGPLHVSGRRIARAVDLLRSAVLNEELGTNGNGSGTDGSGTDGSGTDGSDGTREYIEKLVNGELQGDGPELTVLSNVLRRPISIYELDFDFDDDDDDGNGNGNGNDINNEDSDGADADANSDTSASNGADGQTCAESKKVNKDTEIDSDSDTCTENTHTGSGTCTRSTENGKSTPPINSIPSIPSIPTIPSRCKIKCVGSFGDLFKDPCAEIPNPAVISGLLPGAYSWHIHILVVDAGPGEKHACALLPKECYI